MGWRPDLTQIARSPRSTVVGLCVLALTAERGVRFDAAGHLAMNPRDWFGVGCGVLTAIVSGLSQDAERMHSGQAMTPNTEVLAGDDEPSASAEAEAQEMNR